VDGILDHVVPPHAEQFAPSRSRGERKPPDRVKSIARSHLEETPDLVPAPRGTLDAVIPRRGIDGQDRIHDEVSAPDGVA
jgi:hypothetical protein